MFVKLSFRELRGSKLSGLHPFDKPGHVVIDKRAINGTSILK